MTANQEIYAALIVVNAVINVPLLLHFLRGPRTIQMTISPAAAAIVTQLTDALPGLQALVASASGAQEQEDLAAIGDAASKLVALIPAAPAALAVTPTSLTLALGQPATGTLTASGGTAPYTFAASDTGLTVDASGNVGGSATEASSTIAVTDAAGRETSVSVSAS